MTALAPALGVVFATLVSTSQRSITEPDREFRYAYYTAMSYCLFAFLAARPLLWGIGIVSPIDFRRGGPVELLLTRLERADRQVRRVKAGGRARGTS